jgi:hypothetical protein
MGMKSPFNRNCMGEFQCCGKYPDNNGVLVYILPKSVEFNIQPSMRQIQISNDKKIDVQTKLSGVQLHVQRQKWCTWAVDLDRR